MLVTMSEVPVSGTNCVRGSAFSATYWPMSVELPADTSIVMVGTGQSFPGLLSTYFDPILAAAPDVILADPNFQIQASAGGSTDIDQYVALNANPPTQFVALTGSDFMTSIT